MIDIITTTGIILFKLSLTIFLTSISIFILILCVYAIRTWNNEFTE